jgi:hypothetical protein
MTNENFEKLFTKEHQEAMLATFSITEFPTLKKASKEERLRIIEERHVKISPELDIAIQKYITEHKPRKHPKQLRQMVKKKFGITVV